VDRIDIHIDVPAVAFGKLRSQSRQTDSQALREQVVSARERQRHRFGNHKVRANAHMTHRQLEKHCRLDAIADLDASENVQAHHASEAIGYRRLDRKL
jgi:magnesium chelatase family protein